MKRLFNYFSAYERLLWFLSVVIIVTVFLVFDRVNSMYLISSLIGVTSLIFNAKGNPVGAALMVVFGLLYGIISFSFSYYGEVITYVGMTAPMSFAALVSWLKNPYKGKRSEVTVNKISIKEAVFLAFLTAGVTAAFYFILKYFNTANLMLSTLSVATSFAAVYLTARRSRFFTFVYALNDLVLVSLWALACKTDLKYISVAVCFVVFFVNDLYGFFNWGRMGKRQKQEG
ncbi:MAG: nicotinamide mononucleotide transporter [Ruminococcaceae bacterium]|nr:nicotinamide mononucleotide transporter [Oscillospiraceae bacterium]